MIWSRRNDDVPRLTNAIYNELIGLTEYLIMKKDTNGQLMNVADDAPEEGINYTKAIISTMTMNGWMNRTTMSTILFSPRVVKRGSRFFEGWHAG